MKIEINNNTIEILDNKNIEMTKKILISFFNNENYNFINQKLKRCYNRDVMNYRFEVKNSENFNIVDIKQLNSNISIYFLSENFGIMKKIRIKLKLKNKYHVFFLTNADVLHREDGPAMIELNSDFKIINEYYFLNGKKLNDLQVMMMGIDSK